MSVPSPRLSVCGCAFLGAPRCASPRLCPFLSQSSVPRRVMALEAERHSSLAQPSRNPPPTLAQLSTLSAARDMASEFLLIQRPSYAFLRANLAPHPPTVPPFAELLVLTPCRPHDTPHRATRRIRPYRTPRHARHAAMDAQGKNATLRESAALAECCIVGQLIAPKLMNATQGDATRHAPLSAGRAGASGVDRRSITHR